MSNKITYFVVFEGHIASPSSHNSTGGVFVQMPVMSFATVLFRSAIIIVLSLLPLAAFAQTPNPNNSPDTGPVIPQGPSTTTGGGSDSLANTGVDWITDNFFGGVNPIAIIEGLQTLQQLGQASTNPEAAQNQEVANGASELPGQVVSEGMNENSEIRNELQNNIDSTLNSLQTGNGIPAEAQGALQQALQGTQQNWAEQIDPKNVEFEGGCLHPPTPDPRFLLEDIKTWNRTCKVLGVGNQNVTNSDIGKRVAERYGREGDQYQEGKYKEHQWHDGNPEWLKSWIQEDTQALFEDFWGGLQPSFIGICGIFPTLKIELEYYWPEHVGESNNFCIGSFLAGQFRDPFIKTKDALTKPLLKQIKTKDGEIFDPQNREDPHPDFENPHTGQSHTDDYGFHNGLRTRNYETHVYRTFLDTLLATIAPRDNSITVLSNPLCLLDCLPPSPFKEDQKGRKRRFAINWSEFLLSPFWRIPELSWARVLLTKDEQQGKVHKPLYGTLPGLLYHGTTLSPILPHGDSQKPPRQTIGLSAFTCASYRAAKQRNAIASAMRWQIWPVPIPKMDEICYHQSLGQLYPLVGTVEVNAETTAPIIAIRRMFEWASWDIWAITEKALKFRIRTNTFEDCKEKKNKDDKKCLADTHYGERPGDKLQRLFPEPSKTYKINEVDERNEDLWPIGLIAKDEKFTGNRKEAQWNRRRCCISVYQWLGAGPAGCDTTEE